MDRYYNAQTPLFATDGVGVNVRYTSPAAKAARMWGHFAAVIIGPGSLIAGYEASSLFGRKYFLNADLVNQTPSAQVFQMRPFFVIRQVFANAVDHHHNERAVIHI
jgi:hypothetical protein